MTATVHFNREQREADAARLRAVLDATDSCEPGENQWLTREVWIQQMAVLCRPGATNWGSEVDERKQRLFMTEAGFHLWVKHEARIAAELALAKALGLPVADADVASFLRERDRLLDTPGKRQRFLEEEDYERAVFIMTLAAVQDAQTGQLSARLRDLYRIDPDSVSIVRSWRG